MKRLLKLYGFNSDMQYFERIVFLYLHGDSEPAKVMFLDMPKKKEQKAFIKSALTFWNSGITQSQVINFFFELL